MNNRIKRGNIYMVKLPKITGSVQSGERMFVILQNNVGNKYSPTLIGASVTSKVNKRDLPTHVTVEADNMNKLSKTSTVILEQIMTIDKSQLGDYVGRMSDEYMEQINRGIGISLGLIDNY